MKGYWQVAWVKYPAYRDTDRVFLGSIVVEWEGDGVPDWEEFRRAIFPIGVGEVAELLNPQRTLTSIDDTTRSEQPRLAAKSYKVWVVGNYPNP